MSFSLSDISSGLMVSTRAPRGWDAWPPHPPPPTQTCITFSSHVIFRYTSLGGDGAGGVGEGGVVFYNTLWLKTNADYCRYNFVFKNTVISESVGTCSRARALWGKRVKGMHYSFWLFGVKKNILYILSFSILMKVYLYCFFPPIDWFTCSLDAVFIDVISCFVFSLNGHWGWEGGGGVAFVIRFQVIHQWRCENVYIQKSQHIGPTVWPVVFQYRVFVCWAFLQCWSHSFWGQGCVMGSVGDQPWGERTRRLSLKLNQRRPAMLWTPRIRNVRPIRNDTVMW